MQPDCARDAAVVSRLWYKLIVLFVLCVPASLSAQNEATPPELREIRFVGTPSFPAEVLRAAIISNASGCRNIALDLICKLGFAKARENVDPVALQSDVLRLRIFYYERGFREATVALDTVSEGHVLRATFRIDEGQPVRVTSVELNGLEQLDSASRRVLERMPERLPLRAGQPLSLISYEAARDTLLNRLHDLGYARADVFAGYLIPRAAQHAAQISYDVAPGKPVVFGPADVRGNRKVSSAVIHRMLAFHEGDTFSRAAILRSQRNLFALEVFRNVDITVDLSSPSDTITPVVEVVEGSLNRFRAGVGISTAEFLHAEGSWTGRDFIGGGRTIEVRARVGNVLAEPLAGFPAFENARAPYDALNGSLTADFTQPWFFAAKNQLNAGLFIERRSIPDVFVRTARGGFLGVNRSLGPGTSARIGYRLELTQLDAEDLIFCTSFVACDTDQIRILREPHWLAPLTFSFARDRSNSLFAPTRGNIVRLEGELAAGWSASEFSYSRAIGEWSSYREPFRDLVLASRVRAGWAHATNEPGLGLGLHPQKRFFAGGANSIRGFSQYRLGPKLLTINAVQHLVLDSVSGAGFPGCSAQQINGGRCDVHLLADAAPDRFEVRPVGGAVSFEGNLELRFPVVADKLRGAAFVDVGQVWSEAHEARVSDVVFTPGVGLRYFSAIGPIRIDLGYNTQGAEQITVLTTKVCDASVDPCSPDSIRDGVVYSADRLRNTRVLTQLGQVGWGANRSPWDRLQLHFSIGQAF
jgi:outer membrane protein assembly factor BamA